MTKTGKKYTGVALVMAGILAFCVILTCFTGVRRPQTDKWQIVTSFYPVYIAVLNVTDGVDDVEVVNLVQAQTGCLHDYQLSPDNMRTLLEADLLVLNGAGAESFLTPTLEKMPELAVVELAQGIPLLTASAAHDHEEAEEQEEEGHTDHSGHEHGADNEHIWTSPARYRQEVENLREALCARDPAHEAQYRANAAAYLTAIDEVETRLKAAVAALPYKNSVIFHDSLAYFAQDMGLPVVAAVPVGEEAGASAADLSAAWDAVRATGEVLFLHDSQYDASGYKTLEQAATRCCALSLDMAVTGSGEKSAWLEAMRRNAALLEQVR